jgi:hypothetical protein
MVCGKPCYNQQGVNTGIEVPAVIVWQCTEHRHRLLQVLQVPFTLDLLRCEMRH